MTSYDTYVKLHSINAALRAELAEARKTIRTACIIGIIATVAAMVFFNLWIGELK